jgi:REP element-mobilizing transposase RayT
MALFKDKYRIESVRLPGHDYSQPGAYFITICTHNRQCLFGEIVDGEIMLNKFGELVKTEWQKTGIIRPNIFIDAFVIMPNHLHGILIINDNDEFCYGRDTLQRVSTIGRKTNENNQIEQFGKPTKNSIPTIVRLFKSTTTKQINQIRQTPGIPVWQRNYYEHIIRDTYDLSRIRHYIANNPKNWKNDEYNINPQ